MSNRWTLLASMAVNAAENGKLHQGVTFSNYLEQAYRCGISDASAEKLEDLTMPIVTEMSKPSKAAQETARAYEREMRDYHDSDGVDVSETWLAGHTFGQAEMLAALRNDEDTHEVRHEISDPEGWANWLEAHFKETGKSGETRG